MRRLHRLFQLDQAARLHHAASTAATYTNMPAPHRKELRMPDMAPTDCFPANVDKSAEAVP